MASVRGDGARVPSRDFRESYELTGADNYLAGTSLLGFMGPGVMVAHARLRNGSTYHVEAQRIRGTWHVQFQPAEDGND